MRRIGIILLGLLLLGTMAFGVGAVSAGNIESNATVSHSGDCQVTMTVALEIDEAVEELSFPVPQEAISVTVNGRRVTTKKTEAARVINLNRYVKGMTGEFTLSISYTLPDVVHNTADKTLELRVPLLAGFDYPVEAMDFSVTLPGPTTQKPAFESGYHKADIEKHLRYTVNGATISGFFTQELKDHETVLLTLVVDSTMFPQTLADIQDYTFGEWGMKICAGLAGLYWLLFLAFWPIRFRRTTEAPLGATAGDVHTILYNTGADMHLTVLSWAQLGYIVIEQTRKGKILLHKRMEMGNERRESEQQMFRRLFAKNNTVDTDSKNYAMLCMTAQKKPGMTKDLIRRRSGNPLIFRVITSGIGLFGGVCIAIALGSGAVLQGLLILVLGIAGGVSGWHIQRVGRSILSYDRYRFWLGLVLCGLWLLLGLIAGVFSVALWMVLVTLAAGLLLAWSGRRTEQGRDIYAMTLGYIWNLCRLDKQELQHRCAEDSDEFFRMLPYTLAVGLDKIFAKRLGNTKMDHCPYIIGPDPVYADEWADFFRKVLNRMDRRSRRIPFENLVAAIRSLRMR